MGEVEEGLYEAYVGEAKTALRLKVFAEKTDKEGFPQVGKLFRVIARSEEIHGARSLGMMKGIKSTEENLAGSFESETKVAKVAYGKFIKLAGEEGNDQAVMEFSQARDVEETHAKLHKEAMGHLMEERETTYFICKACGYVSDGVLPDECPICAAKKEQFEEH